MLHFTPLDQPEPAPFERIDGRDDADMLLICDHASAVIPSHYAELGLATADRFAHVAWDIGAAEVTRGLARRLGCPAVLGGVSRLVIDCNRQPGDPSSIPANSCGVPVPGNANLDEAEADARAERWFWPYHQEIGTQLAHLFRRGTVPAMVSVHSFTPCMGSAARPWHVGVLSNRDVRMSEPVLRALRARPDLVVGDNQPYSAREINYTLDTHAGAAGLPHVSFEIRQDLVADAPSCAAWADLLAEVLAPVLADPALRRVQVF
ncbi:MAG TPA: N-formylglutamate amidohydrolase [Magnetospirillum sp.]|nr:N-formylglutamate amidohydrolase [Magnetospirillum sp.]